MTDADCPGVPRTGRALWQLRARYLVLNHVDLLVHRISRTRHVDTLDGWPCWQFDSAYLERYCCDPRMDRTSFRVVDPAVTIPARIALNLDDE